MLAGLSFGGTTTPVGVFSLPDCACTGLAMVTVPAAAVSNSSSRRRDMNPC